MSKETVSESIIVRVHRGITAVAAEHNSRYAIAGVCFRKIKKHVVGVATDGRTLAVVRCQTDGDWPKGLGSVIVPTVAIKSLAEKRGPMRGFASIRIASDGVFGRVEMPGFNPTDVPVELIDGTFPPFEDLFKGPPPDDEGVPEWFSVNPDLLSNLYKALRQGWGTERSPMMSCVNKAKAIRVRVGDNIGLVMPMAFEEDAGSSWADSLKSLGLSA